MKRLVVSLSAVAFVVALLASPVRAQLAVFDPANYLEAIAQVDQMIKEYQLLITQATRLPGNMTARYHAVTPAWTMHDLSALYARRILEGLNAGDASGTGYGTMTDPLTSFLDYGGAIPPPLYAPLRNQYGNVELADAVATRAIDQVGQLRSTAVTDLRVIDAMQEDAVSGDDRFHTQAALLNKINTANVLGLRLAAQQQQLLGSAVEQLLVDNMRKRDAETRLMNAIVNQWQYGRAYGEDLFSQTAAHLDGWRPF